MSSSLDSSKEDGTRGLTIGAIVLATLMLALSGFTAFVALRQTAALKETVERASQGARANVRVLAQAQREMLFLEMALRQQAPDPMELHKRISFLDQRMQQATLPDQRATYVSETMMEQVKTQRTHWLDHIKPKVLLWLQQGAAAETEREEALAEITKLEYDYNSFLSAAEDNRKTAANDSTKSAQRAMQRTKQQLYLLVAAFAATALAMLLGANLVRSLLLQRSRANRQLAANNAELAEYAQIVRATSSMVMVSDDRGRIEWVNDAFATATGWGSADLVGQNAYTVTEGALTDPQLHESINASMRAGHSWMGEHALYTRDGELAWWATNITPLLDADGHVGRVVSVSTDVTQQHELASLMNRARTDAERSAAEKATFLATMSHEIRTPLNSVLGLTDLLRLTSLDPEQREYVETAHRSGKHLLALLNDILDYSALDAGRFDSRAAPFDIARATADAIDILRPQADRKGIDLELVLAPDLPHRVVGDEVHLRQILLNVAGNAVKFTESGSVQVHLEGSEPEGDEVPLRITVTDTGIGIAAEHLGSLFDPFVQGDVSTTRRFGGTGLGLAITKGLAERLGGSIAVTSRPGKGTIVEVVLPMRVETTDETAETVHSDAEPGFEHLQVLCAEDDPVNRTVLSHMLKRLDITPVMVPNGQAAVDAALAESYDVVLLDLQMPVLDGLGAMEEIRARLGEDAPYIAVVTADALTGDRERLLAAGMDDYLTKPISLEGVTEMFRRAVWARRTHSSSSD